MTTATLTSKGQLTIPKAVRDSLHLQTGDQVIFTVNTGNEAVITPMTKSVDDVFGLLHRPDEKAKSTEEMKDAVLKRMRPQG